MRIMHIALGGCLSAAPVRYGLTEDTGGHIAYVLGAAAAQAARADVTAVTIVTRAFEAPLLGSDFATLQESLGPKRSILRLKTKNTAYLEKADLVGELPALRSAFLTMLKGQPRPSVIHAHFADAAELAQAAEAEFGIPWVFTAHSLALQKEDTGEDPERLRREKAAITKAHAIIASSRDEAERQIPAYQQQAAGRTHHVPPGVSIGANDGPGRAQRLVQPWLSNPSKPVILAIARPVQKKNLGALVRAFASSPALQDRANLVILAGQRRSISAGSSETDTVIRDLFAGVDRNDLWGRVALPRRHDTRDVRSFYALAARNGVFVNPAVFEPFGLTVVEAAQSGVPVVATKNGGPACILDAVGFGRTIDPRDPAAIAAACLEMLEVPRAEALNTATERARDIYSWTEWARRTAQIYAGLIPPRRYPILPSRLLVSDMDGTLTGSAAGVDRLNADLSARQDIALVVATGRSIPEARRILAHWKIPEPQVLITSVGSEIWRRASSGGYELDQEFANQIAIDWAPKDIRRITSQLGLISQPCFEQRAWKLSYFGNADDADTLRQELMAADIPARVIASHGRFIDVVPRTSGKAGAADHVARGFGLRPQDCLAAGDSGNDRDLLCWAGRAVIPSNGLSEIADLQRPNLHRAEASYADGVLEALNRWNSTKTPPLLLAAE